MATESITASPDKDQQIANLNNIVADLNHNIDQMKAAASQKYQAYQIARYDDQIALMKARQHLYEWQNFASNVMLWTSVLVVIIGLLMSVAQLYQALKLGVKTDGTVEVSAQGLKITSSIVGVIILAISIAFIVIFVDQVYTIKDASMAVAAAQAGSRTPYTSRRSR